MTNTFDPRVGAGSIIKYKSTEQEQVQKRTGSAKMLYKTFANLYT